MKTQNFLLLLGAAGVAAFLLIKKGGSASRSYYPTGMAGNYPDPLYERGYEEDAHPAYTDSTDDEGGVLFHNQGALSRRGGRLQERRGGRLQDQGYANYPVPTGGTFINPNVLPPPRSARIEGGRFAPAADWVLPGFRTERIQGGRFVPKSHLPPTRVVFLE